MVIKKIFVNIINNTNKEKILGITSILTIGIILVIILINDLPAKINENAIYPKGSIINAKIFDISNNEIQITLNQDDVDFIIQTIKDSDKELAKGYKSGMIEVNITFTDSSIQLLREDANTVYYVFHNYTYNSVCYKVHSNQLSVYLQDLTARLE